jgi:ATP-dependent RNA helicase DDX10/DBP4
MSATLKRKRSNTNKNKKHNVPAPAALTFENEEEEIRLLTERITNESPAAGVQTQTNTDLRFDSLPLSKRTLYGLSSSKLEKPTEIQSAAVPHALAGRDILGAAKTGSGKTLAFVIPILEKLFRERWTSEDGLAAIIISPTRELAFQIFEVLRTVGKKHLFSAGLITGGKKEFFAEQERIVSMNILVASPGRLLQHFEQTTGFDASQLMILVLDEADRILDMGFKSQLDAIVNYIPKHRQTLLFSATQTKSVKDLARLSLNHPEYIAVHEKDQEVTPKQLIQNYIITPLHRKLDILFSFIKSHLKSKIIVFFATCNQVRFLYECFRSMQPGIIVLALHGKIKQERRTMIYSDFLKKPSACMLATDIAARGLDFPNVDWVIQADAPEDSAMYIHRVGRTARYNQNGKALLMLMPHEEEPVTKLLKESLVPIKKLSVNPKRTFSVSSSASALLAAHSEYRNYAKKAFTGYLRSIQLLSFFPLQDIRSLPLSDFATSLGLPTTPELPIIEKKEINSAKDQINKSKNVNRALDKLKKQIQEAKEAKRLKREEKLKTKMIGEDDSASDLSDSDSDDEDSVMTDNTSSDSSSQEKKKKNIKANKYSVNQMRLDIEKKRADNEDDDEEDEFLAVKKVHKWNEDNDEEGNVVEEETKQEIKDLTKSATKIKIAKDGKAKNVLPSQKVVFDDEGNVVDKNPKLVSYKEKEKAFGDIQKRVEKHAMELKEKLDASREEDELREKERLREKKLQRKQALKPQRDENEGDALGAVLAAPVEEYEDEDESDSGDEVSNDEGGFDGEADEDDDSSPPEDSEQERSVSSDESESESENENHNRKKPKLSLKEQEMLALQILSGKK